MMNMKEKSNFLRRIKKSFILSISITQVTQLRIIGDSMGENYGKFWKE